MGNTKINSEFVWTLGYDDELQSEAIDVLMRNLSENKQDIVIFNGSRETKKEESSSDDFLFPKSFRNTI